MGSHLMGQDFLDFVDSFFRKLSTKIKKSCLFERRPKLLQVTKVFADMHSAISLLFTRHDPVDFLVQNFPNVWSIMTSLQVNPVAYLAMLSTVYQHRCQNYLVLAHICRLRGFLMRFTKSLMCRFIENNLEWRGFQIKILYRNFLSIC